MKIQDAIQCLDQLCRNNRTHCTLTGCPEEQKADLEQAGQAAVKVIHACELAGARTTEEAVSLLRVCPMFAEQNKMLQGQLIKERDTVSELQARSEMQRLMLEAILPLINTPGMSNALAAAFESHQDEGFAAIGNMLSKLQELTALMKKGCR